ncbi:E3 ubiquitin-protein ligase WAV3 [Brassica napus]|uniref:RING-type domain-containing protein n=2 Tax=Brassica TaxID=3705 RepID=A0A0D3C8F3_BRAOL|nr:PREDICTED: uncharacterized protein LOC106294548 [Brassica oleracea var. oleracea]XP_013708756.1 E3 ubiquitin-protein ligase WAV3 [Brassica napus]CAF1924194.1 unnamed protein product [Brassica napus]
MENPNETLNLPKIQDPSSTDDASRSSVDSTRPDPSAPPPLPSSSSKNECAICLDEIVKGDGKALFTAECCHTFHFDCITTNVKHGNKICPLCRTQWKQVPSFLDNSRPPSRFHIPLPVPPLSSPPQISFEDDELLPQAQAQAQAQAHGDQRGPPPLEVKLVPQVSAVAKQATTLGDFAVLVHLKAGVVSDEVPSRAPLDLVAVLDVSSSMDGAKMELLKNAVGFVIQNLGETDRLSVVVFSSDARRLFPLKVMSVAGKREAIQAVNSLVADGCTNIAEGLKVGARVIEDRRCRSPVPVMMLLSDGQDNYTFSQFGFGVRRQRTNYESLLPSSTSQVPIHAFGFGSDHDAELMHAISRVSSGTFSFIETETVIRDAFAQCIGGLLSVVVLEQVVEIECVHQEGVKISSIKAGSYRNSISSDGRSGTISVGDMYAEEERDFLVVLEIPSCESESMSLLKVRCVYKDPVTRETVRVESGELIIQRPDELTGEEVVSIEVDRQRNRFLVSQAISEAKVLADGGDVRAAAELLRKSERDLAETLSARAGDGLCESLTFELRALQEKMRSMSMYQTSGRAYALSSMSSHSAQRATARYSPTSPGYSPGPAGYSMPLPQAYQTSAMARMVTRSQQLGIQSPTPASPAPGDQT